MDKQGQAAEIVPIDPATAGAPARPAATPSVPSPTGFSNHAIHLVRTSMQMNLALSQMADQKASILMGATFVVFTIAVGQARAGGDIPYSLAVLALFAFLSALFAVFAVLPSIRPPKQNVSQLNKLFFGHFTQMAEQDWADAIVDDLRADETVFRAMLHDIYQNGQVLQGKKYKYLGNAYRIFIVGLSLTLLTFIAERAGLLGV